MYMLLEETLMRYVLYIFFVLRHNVVLFLMGLLHVKVLAAFPLVICKLYLKGIINFFVKNILGWY